MYLGSAGICRQTTIGFVPCYSELRRLQVFLVWPQLLFLGRTLRAKDLTHSVMARCSMTRFPAVSVVRFCSELLHWSRLGCW